MFRSMLIFSCLLGTIYSKAQVQLARVFGDSMILQRDAPIVIWGWAPKGERVQVQFGSGSASARAGGDGKWMVRLKPLPPGGPHQLIVTGRNKIELKEIMMGDVWICSGQSNMEWPVGASRNAPAEIAAANYAQIRQFTVPKAVAGEPAKELAATSGWRAATPANVASFTAVGYFFARRLHQSLGVPIGLINTSWGGTDIETWTSRSAFEQSPDFANMIGQVKTIDLESVSKKRQEAMMQKLQSMQNGLPDAREAASWKDAAANDETWAQMNLPGLWEEGLLTDFDGLVWFRKTVSLSSAEAAAPAVLHLAKVDDADRCYINGVEVGSTDAYNAPRVYSVPAGTLKAGENVIAVRVHDTGGGGGIYGDSSEMFLQLGNNKHALAGPWKFRVEAAASNTAAVGPNTYPTLLYNAMIHPLIPIGIKGAIWYQGESNAGRAYEYRKAFPLMINDWRTRWGQSFPFYFVQLASFDANGGNSEKGSDWAELREAQTATLSLPNTGMAVTTDIGDPKDIHPTNKQDVGWRLAALALAKTYGQAVPHAGPVFKSMLRDGARLIVQFDSNGAGLKTNDKYGYLKGFEIAGADQRFHYARAHIAGNTVVVEADAVKEPTALRFAWSDDTNDANLFNVEGFPAQPFRTDDWKMVTRDVKYSR